MGLNFRTLERTLRLVGFHSLASYAKGTSEIGKPSRTWLSIELIEQGAWVFLSGVNNLLAMQTNHDWIWPLWAERQRNPRIRDFVPTGAGIIATNLTHRNWTALGSGEEGVAMVDGAGMLTLGAHEWSLLPYIRLPSQTLVPQRSWDALEQSLGGAGVVQTTIVEPSGLRWGSVVRSLGSGAFELLIWAENHAETDLRGQLGAAVRPYNALSIGHVFSAKSRSDFLLVNGRERIHFNDPPSHYSWGNRPVGDPLCVSRPPSPSVDVASDSGIASAAAEWNFALKPGHRVAKRLTAWSFVRGRSASEHREVSSLSFLTPDTQLTSRLQGLLWRMQVFDCGTHFAPGAFMYGKFWFRDAFFLSEAFDMLGCHKSVARKLAGYPRRQKLNGYFRCHNGEWDSNGQALLAVSNHVRRTRNLSLLELLYPCFIRSTRWLERLMNSCRDIHCVHCGLLPAGFSAEHFGGNDHYFWDNFWALRALHESAWAARTLGRDADAARADTAIEILTISLNRAICTSLERVRRSVLPASPTRQPDAASIGNLVASSPLNLQGIVQEWLGPTTEYLLSDHFLEGLFFQSVFHTGLNPYLSAQVARVLLKDGDSRWWCIFRALSRHATPTGTWPEAIHPQTGGGCMGDGDHGWAAAEFLILARNLFVLEDGEDIVFGMGIPAEWFFPGKVFSLENAPSFQGMTSCRFVCEESGVRVAWSVKRPSLRTQVRLSFPPGVLAPGPAGPFIATNHRELMTVPPTGEIVVPWKRSAS